MVHRSGLCPVREECLMETRFFLANKRGKKNLKENIMIFKSLVLNFNFSVISVYKVH